MAMVNGREVGRKIDELLTGFAVVFVVSAVLEAVTELNFEPLSELGGAILKGIFE